MVISEAAPLSVHFDLIANNFVAHAVKYFV